MKNFLSTYWTLLIFATLLVSLFGCSETSNNSAKMDSIDTAGMCLFAHVIDSNKVETTYKSYHKLPNGDSVLFGTVTKHR